MMTHSTMLTVGALAVIPLLVAMWGSTQNREIPWSKNKSPPWPGAVSCFFSPRSMRKEIESHGDKRFQVYATMSIVPGARQYPQL